VVLGEFNHGKSTFINALLGSPLLPTGITPTTALLAHVTHGARAGAIAVDEAGERTPELFYNTGLLLQKSGQVEDAVRLYQEALSDRPNFPEALLNLGHALKSQGKPDEAREFWRQALEQKPELAAGYFGQ